MLGSFLARLVDVSSLRLAVAGDGAGNLDVPGRPNWIYARLGGVYIVLGQGDLAAAVFHQGVLRFPKLPEAHYFAGVAARAAADYSSAEAELRKALALEPDNVNALAQLGFVLLEKNRASEAETILRRAIAINNKHFYANYDLGRLFVRSRRYDEALSVLRQAATVKPNNPGVHYQLFMALSRLKSARV